MDRLPDIHIFSVNWSTAVRMRNERPSASLSFTESMLQYIRSHCHRRAARRGRRPIFVPCLVRTIKLLLAYKSVNTLSIHLPTPAVVRAPSSADIRSACRSPPSRTNAAVTLPRTAALSCDRTRSTIPVLSAARLAVVRFDTFAEPRGPVSAAARCTAFLTRSPAESVDPGSESATSRFKRPFSLRNCRSSRSSLPAYCFSQAQCVASPPTFRHSSFTFSPASACRTLPRSALPYGPSSARPFSSPGLFCLRYLYFPSVQFFGFGSHAVA
jgi:hypothetical protein